MIYLSEFWEFQIIKIFWEFKNNKNIKQFQISIKSLLNSNFESDQWYSVKF